MRLHQPLTQDWQLAPDLDAAPRVEPDGPKAPLDGWRSVAVPGIWQLQHRDLVRATGPVWYRTSFHLGDDWLERDHLVLRFGAVSHFAQGWLNGRYLGEHEGGHLPFLWEVGGSAVIGDNELLVRVVTPSGDVGRYPDHPFEETLHGKQSWYGPNGGIWQEVAIEGRSRHAISSLGIHPRPDSGSVGVVAEIGSTSSTVEIDVEVRSPDDELVGEARGGAPGASIDIPVAGVRRWSPDTPDLYRVKVTARRDGEVVDELEKRFGFRSFTTDRGRFLLNGEPLVLRGVLDQDYYDSPGVPSGKEALLERFRLVKEMGFNTLRCHVKIPEPSYLDAADEVGLLVWCELPMTSRLTAAARERIEQTLAGAVERDRHHPSIVIWTISNESWGFDLVGDPEHRRLLHELYRKVKASLPDRLIVDNSPCHPNFHIETDIEDFHFYAVIPEMRHRWDDFLEQFSGRAAFTFSPHGDDRRTGDEPLVVSEFGVWGLPDLSELTSTVEPWWFETGQEWGGGAAYVHGAEERFQLWHLDRVFGSWAGLCAETQRRQFETMRYQIESMRVRPEIAGYVVTELGDVHWEANGLLDMTGRPRTFVDRLPALNASTSLVPRLSRPAMWDDEAVELDLTVVNGPTSRPSSEVRSTMPLGSDVIVPVRDLAANEVRALGAVEVRVPRVAGPTVATIDSSLLEHGVPLSTADRSIVVIPRAAATASRPGRIAVRDDVLAGHLEALGYVVDSPGRGDELRLLRHLEDDDHHFLRSGGRALLLPADARAFGRGFFDFPRIALRSWRDALAGGGEWISAFSWLRRSGPFVDLPGGPMMDLTFDGLAPEVVITGIPPSRYEYAVFAGVFVGWVHQVAALIARHDIGFGSVLVCTLKLAEGAAGDDPIATWMLHRLIAMAREQA